MAACASGGSASSPAATPMSTPASAVEPNPATPGGAAAGAVAITETARAVIAAPDRSDADKKLDAGRHPAELLSVFHIGPGMKVGEIAAGGGYTTELLARAVGPTGVVYAENMKTVLERFAEKPWSERLAKPVMKNVVRVDREPGDPFPAEAHDLDAVLCVLFYHDFFHLGVDRDKLNAAVFRALKHGGVYGIVDHSARTGDRGNEAKTFHRVEESLVRSEVERAGFKLRSEGNFLRNPSDTRDWNDSPMAAGDKRGTSDRFVLAFEKP
jgi:predicted methyltransferase